MNVLQVGSSLYDWGGIERYVWYLKTALEGRGHSVSVIAPPASRLAELTNAEPLALRGKHNFSQLPQFVRYFRSRPFDVVHCHYSPDFVVPGIAAALAKIPRRVITRHLATTWSVPKARIYSRLWPNMIAVSDAVREALIQSRIPAGQVVTAYAGIPDFPSVTPRVLDGFQVGFFGRLVPEKGVDVLLRAAALAPGITLNIFGSGDEAAKLKALAKELQLHERAIFHGQVSDVEGYVASMHAIAIPSIWAEPFPYSGLEAMALGKPVIASATGGLPEMIRDGLDGWVVKPNSPEDFAAGLNSASADPVEAAKRGQNGRLRQQHEFTLAKFGERIETAYLGFKR